MSGRASRLRVFGRNRIALVGLVLGLLIAGAATAAPLISRLDPLDQSPAHRLDAPDAAHPMGRDTFGRDVFARVLQAGRFSLVVGIGSVALGAALGTLLGLLAGYGGRWADTAVMRVVDLLMAFPSLLLGMVVLTVLGAGFDRTILAIGVVAGAALRARHSWPDALAQAAGVRRRRPLPGCRSRPRPLAPRSA